MNCVHVGIICVWICVSVYVCISQQEKKMNISFLGVAELRVFAFEKSDFGLSDIIFDALSGKKNHVANSSLVTPRGVYVAGKCLRRKSPPLPLGGLEFSWQKLAKKVVKSDRLGERSSNPMSIFIFDNFIKSYWKKLIFQKYLIMNLFLAFW